MQVVRALIWVCIVFVTFFLVLFVHLDWKCHKQNICTKFRFEIFVLQIDFDQTHFYCRNYMSIVQFIHTHKLKTNDWCIRLRQKWLGMVNNIDVNIRFQCRIRLWQFNLHTDLQNTHTNTCVHLFTLFHAHTCWQTIQIKLLNWLGIQLHSHRAFIIVNLLIH